MYDYNGYDYGYEYSNEAVDSLGTIATGFAAFGVVVWLISMAISIFTIVCNWKMFKKAGKGGWEAIIPIYNIIVMMQIAELPLWHLVLLLIPFANIYVMFKLYIELAHKFNKSTVFGVGLVFLYPIFIAILAFDKNAVYVGNQSNVAQNQQPTQQQNQPTMQQPLNSNPAFCTGCGSALAPNTKFCTYCGKQV